MSFTHTLKRGWGNGSRAIEGNTNYTGDGQLSRSIAVPESTTDMEVAAVIDVDQIQSLYIKSDKDMTLETNSASSPIDTIALLAGVPYIWNVGDYSPCLFGTDVTAIFLTTGVVGAAVFEMEVLVDSTV